MLNIKIINYKMFVPLKENDLLNVMKDIAFKDRNYTEIAMLYIEDQYNEIYQIIKEEIIKDYNSYNIKFNGRIGYWLEYFSSHELYIDSTYKRIVVNNFIIRYSTFYFPVFIQIYLEPYKN
jgi:hypothetical protein